MIENIGIILGSSLVFVVVYLLILEGVASKDMERVEEIEAQVRWLWERLPQEEKDRIDTAHKKRIAASRK